MELKQMDLDDCHLAIHRALIRFGRLFAANDDYWQALYVTKYLLGLVTAEEAERLGGLAKSTRDSVGKGA